MVQVTGEVTEDTGRLGWVQLLRQRSFVVPQLLTCWDFVILILWGKTFMFWNRILMIFCFGIGF